MLAYNSLCVSLIVLSTNILSLILAQTEGDVRLTGGQNSSYFGRVEVFYKGKWGTVCDHNYGGAADVICHQLTLSSNSKTFPGTSMRDMNKQFNGSEFHIKNLTNSGGGGGGGGPMIHLMDIDCGAIYSNPPNIIHIMRCDFFHIRNESDSECTHEDDLAVFCDSREEDTPYVSEVRLVGGEFASTGTLEIYLNDTWGNLCHRGLNQFAADTSCRQMGYTHAKSITGTRNRSRDVVWFDEISCGIKSSQCLSYCFDENSISQGSCTDGEYAVLQCGFDLNRSSELTSGNPILCPLTKRYSKIKAYFVAIMSVAGLLWITSVIFIITVAVCYKQSRCPCYRYMQRKNKYILLRGKIN